jgi:hypothetical protein
MLGGSDRSLLGGLLWGGGAMMRGRDCEGAWTRDKEVTPEAVFTETKSGLNDPGLFQR